MQTLRLHLAREIAQPESAYGVIPLEEKELVGIGGGNMLLMGCLIGASIGGVFVAAAIIAATYYVFFEAR